MTETENISIIRNCFLDLLKREPDELGLNHFLKLFEKNEINKIKLQDMIKSSVEYKVTKWRDGKYSTQNPPAGNFFIKKNYWHRIEPIYFIQEKSMNTFQPPYDLVKFLGEFFHCSYIIDIGCGNAKKLVKFYPQFKIIGIDFMDNINLCKHNFEFGHWIEADLECDNLMDIPEEILKHSILICSEVIEHLTNPTNLLKNLKNLLNYSSACIVTTPERDLLHGTDENGPSQHVYHVREWNGNEFLQLLRHFEFNVHSIGLTKNSSADTKNNTIITCLQNNNPQKKLLDYKTWGYPNPTDFSLTSIHNNS